MKTSEEYHPHDGGKIQGPMNGAVTCKVWDEVLRGIVGMSLLKVNVCRKEETEVSAIQESVFPSVCPSGL